MEPVYNERGTLEWLRDAPYSSWDGLNTGTWGDLPNKTRLHVGISDHSLIYATHKHNTLKADPKIIESRQFKNFS